MTPIEIAFSKLKALLRQEPARTLDGLAEHIGRLLNHFYPAERGNSSRPLDINGRSENALGIKTAQSYASLSR